MELFQRLKVFKMKSEQQMKYMNQARALRELCKSVSSQS